MRPNLRRHLGLRGGLVFIAISALLGAAAGVALADTGDYDSDKRSVDPKFRQLPLPLPGQDQPPAVPPVEAPAGEDEEPSAELLNGCPVGTEPGPRFSPPPSTAPPDSSKPSSGAAYRDRPSGSFLLDGRWYFHPDPDNIGQRSHWEKKRTLGADWYPIGVPYTWNAGVNTLGAAQGSTGWYWRKFKLPSSSKAADWLLRFESVNFRATVWLNGKKIGKHGGAYLPFELLAKSIKRRGNNVLVVRVDSRRYSGDFPPGRTSADGCPTNGWWPYGGILREVYVRKINDLALDNVQSFTRLAGSRARIKLSADVTNYSGKTRSAKVRGVFGRGGHRKGFQTRTKTLKPRQTETLKTKITVKKPPLWTPQNPVLTPVSFSLKASGAKKKGKKGKKGGGKGFTAGRWKVRTGVRSVTVGGGILRLNGHQLDLRGYGLHEDSVDLGAAMTNAQRLALMTKLKDSGATIIRSHYPLHPYIHELADQMGMFIWSEVPVYAVRSAQIKKESVQKRAVDLVEQNIKTNGSHPSVLLWSIGNELGSQASEGQADYIRQAKAMADDVDGTRPVGIALAGYPLTLFQSAYDPLDVLGINDYFGWYDGPMDSLKDRNGLGPYLDRMHSDYPGKALFVSEFGAEANRDGSVSEKGTYAFQRDWTNFQLDTIGQRPYLAGAIYWTIQEFRIRPGWDGGNPKAGPNLYLHQKGLINYDGSPKSAYDLVRARYLATPPVK